jgi:hypothetical protein
LKEVGRVRTFDPFEPLTARRILPVRFPWKNC